MEVAKPERKGRESPRRGERRVAKRIELKKKKKKKKKGSGPLCFWRNLEGKSWAGSESRNLNGK